VTAHPTVPSDLKHSGLTAHVHPRSFDGMATLWGIRCRRAVQSCRRLVLTTAAGFAGVLAGCSDSAPVAPPAARAALTALPAAPRYVIELAAGQAPSSALTAQIRADGGRIVFSHAPTGIVIVAGLSAKSAGALRLRAGVQAVVADVYRMRVTDPPFTRMQVRSIRPSAVHPRSFTREAGPTRGTRSSSAGSGT